jgi:hypothetical protein
LAGVRALAALGGLGERVADLPVLGVLGDQRLGPGAVPRAHGGHERVVADELGGGGAVAEQKGHGLRAPVDLRALGAGAAVVDAPRVRVGASLEQERQAPHVAAPRGARGQVPEVRWSQAERRL